MTQHWSADMWRIYDAALATFREEAAAMGVEANEPTVPGPLDARHRCDRCGAQAYVAVVLISGGRLDFCGHHFDKAFEQLFPLMLHTRDERRKLRTQDGTSISG